MRPPRREPFVDVARAGAVLAMIQGHVANALLAPAYQQGLVFATWLFLRGLTSCLFLLLSGFSFALAVSRQTDNGTPRPGDTTRRLRRYGLLLLLGYALQLPVRPIWRLFDVTPEQWRAFVSVNILQVVTVTLVGLHLLQWMLRTPRRLEPASLAGAIAIAGLTPLAWTIDRWVTLPAWLLAYVTGTQGSFFPVFPWSGYILLGVVVGFRYVRLRDGAAGGRQGDDTTVAVEPRLAVARPLAAGGAALIALSVVSQLVPLSPYGPIDYWSVSPSLFLIRAGLVALLLAGIAWITRLASTPPWVLALSRQSLAIYVVHLAVVYGSIWNDGLRQYFGATLDPARLVAWILVVIAAMAALAWAWERWVPRQGVAGLSVRSAVAVALIWPLT